MFGGQTHPDFGRIKLARYNHGILYTIIGAVDGGGTSILGMAGTTDGGQSWPTQFQYDPSHFHGCSHDAPLNNPFSQPRLNLYVKVDPLFPNIVYVGIGDLFRSTDGGANFADQNCLYSGQNAIHQDQHAFAFRSGLFISNIIFGNDGGLWSLDWTSPATLTNLNDTLSTLQMYAGDLTSNFAADPNAQALGGTQDNATVVYTASTSPDSHVWQNTSAQFYGGDGLYTAIEPNGKRNAYLENEYGNIQCSTSGVNGSYLYNCAGGWVDVNRNPLEHQGFNTPFILDHLNCGSNACQHLVLGTSRVWETINGGLNSTDWYATSPTLTKVYTDLHYIRALAFAPQGTATVYAGTSDGNMLFTNNANTGSPADWVDITVANTQMPNRSVSGIAVSPVDTATAYIAFDGFNANTPQQGHLYQMRLCKINCGSNTATWTDLSGNLPDIPVYAVMVNPLNSLQVFIGTEIGFYYTNNINTTTPVVWNRFQTGLPVAAINQLTIDKSNTTLVAWTNGRGAYALTLPSWRIVPSPNYSNGTLYATAALTSTDVWAVGQSENEHTITEHWNGSTWITVTNPLITSPNNSLKAISALSANDIWAVGQKNYNGMAMHWDGTSWSATVLTGYTGIDNLYGVAALSHNNVWAVGGGYSGMQPSPFLIEHWDGSQWQGVITTTTIVTATSAVLQAVSAVDANNIWAVGSYGTNISGTLYNKPLIERYNGSNWVRIDNPNVAGISNELLGVKAFSVNDVWAVGDTDSSAALILHYNGTSWQVVSNPYSGILRAIGAVSATDMWAVGQISENNALVTLVLHGDGSRWVRYNSETIANRDCRLFGVAAVSHNDAWAVGHARDLYSSITLRERWSPNPQFYP